MAVTQYIGARYVPLFADPMQWDSTKTYEPLTIVYNEGNSYTSRQYVPAGIQIDDDSYWALTGNYNAQIEQYRTELKRYDGRITTVESDTAQLKTDTAQLKTDVSQLKTDTAQLDTDLTETKVDVSKNATDIVSIKGTLAAITPLDTVPTMNSTKGVTSDGVYKALQATVESTRKCIVVIGDSWVMTDPTDTTKPYYSHWLTLFKNRYPDNVFFTRYADTTPTTIIRTKQEIDILAADNSFKNADVTDVLMIAGLNGGTSADAASVAAYAREKFNDNLTFTWAQDCYTPLRAIYGGVITAVDATPYINNTNSATNDKYIDLSSILISPHFFSNDSNNADARGAKIIGFHPSQAGSQRLFSFFADYFFSEHLGAWGKQPFNASNFNSCFCLCNSAGNRYNNTAVSVESTFVDYERGTFKIGFYSATPYSNLDVCNFQPVSDAAIPTLQLPLVPNGIVQSVAVDNNFFKAFGILFFGNASKQGLTLMEGKMGDASLSTNTFFLGA
nr:MAG TPA: acetylesterase [Bacteriophage sp.]